MCSIHFQTDGGVYGFTLLEDHEFYAKDTRPDAHIPDLSQNPNDPFDNSKRRRLQASNPAHYTLVPRGRSPAHGADPRLWRDEEDVPSPGIPARDF